MLHPQQQPQANKPLYNWPSFVGLDFKVQSKANPTNIHYLKIATQFTNIYFVYPYLITGTWEGASNDVHHMTGHIGGDFSISCSWSAMPGSVPNRFLTGTLTKTSSGWQLDGAVKDSNGNLVGPGNVTGMTI